MDSSVILGAVVGLAGSVLGSLTTVLVQRSARRQAERVEAGRLLAQVQRGVDAWRLEIVTFVFRRRSRRANARATGQAVLEVLAGGADGNWLRGMATAVRDMRGWDSAEADRFQVRLDATYAEINPGLVLLSLFEPPIQRAAAQLSDALRAYGGAETPGDRQAASGRVDEGIDELSASVRAFVARRWWRRRPR